MQITPKTKDDREHLPINRLQGPPAPRTPRGGDSATHAKNGYARWGNTEAIPPSKQIRATASIVDELRAKVPDKYHRAFVDNGLRHSLDHAEELISFMESFNK